jgi:hypothetical protein
MVQQRVLELAIEALEIRLHSRAHGAGPRTDQAEIDAFRKEVHKYFAGGKNLAEMYRQGMRIFGEARWPLDG